jgi:3-oxoacyl-[acyl-carrier protein] reductase
MKLKDQIAIVTGGGGAIGGAIARGLAAEGAKIILLDIRAELAAKTASAIEEAGGSAQALGVDITDPLAVRENVDQIVARHGRVDILVNCAGGGPRKRMKLFHEQSLDVVYDLIKVNLFGSLHLIHAVSPHMVAAEYGKIVNIASIVGVQGRAKFVEYSASKGGIIAATKSLAKELGPYNINVNCVSPGQIPREQPDDPEAFARRHTFLNRVGRPEDIAGLVLYLTLPETGFITGQNYIVDGGRSLAMQGSDTRG